MRVYVLHESDFETLLAAIDRDPRWGSQGGSSNAGATDEPNLHAHEEAHAFFNYQVRGWISKMKEPTR